MSNVITGDLHDLKKYVNENLIFLSDNLYQSKTDKEKYIVFPEHFKNFEEQRNLITVLEKNNMNFNIITNSPFIISDVKQEKLFVLDENQNLNQSKLNNYGMSLEMIYFNLFKQPKSIGSKSFNDLEELRFNINNDNYSKDEVLKELSYFGDSFEKSNVIGILRQKETSKELEVNEFER